MTKWNLFQLCKAGTTFENQSNAIYHINKLKKKNWSYQLTDKKTLDNIQNPLIKKEKSSKYKNRGMLPQLDKRSA